jgi:antitoxin PrlF
MPMITSKLSTKSQTTIPQAVRVALDLKEGDGLAYTIEDRDVLLSKVSRRNVYDPFATFSEWDGEADQRVYAKL